ncbi:hypothetical protein PCI56_09030 [Plesiomonas shigelloides subsp. oncorhynchi]|nr:hypothetical protein [Plesiomonas shigelloides]
MNRFINWLSEGPRSATVECLMAEEVPFANWENLKSVKYT